MKTSEKVAFIKGLMEGLAMDTAKPETKILNYMVEVLEELASSNNALIEENIKLRDYIEELDEDLGMVEELIYSEDEDDEDAEYGYYDDEDEDDWGFEDDEDEEDEEDEDDDPIL